MPWMPISRAGRRLLTAASIALLSSCSTPPSGPATPTPPLPPMSCQVECPPVPELTDGSLPTLRRWVDDLLNLYHDCRRTHAACANDLNHDRHF